MICRVAEDNDQGSDHLPIETTIALQVLQPQPTPPFNYEKTNWEVLRSKLKIYLAQLVTASLVTSSDIDNFATELIAAILRAVNETTPRKRPCQHSKRWWNEDLTKLRREANWLRNVYRCTKAEVDNAAWRAKANKYMQEIAKAKTNKWKEFTDQADGKSIW